MKKFDPLFKMIDDESKGVVAEHLKKCNEGFDIKAEQHCRLAVMGSYIDFLVDTKRLDMTQTKKLVDRALNTMIEKYNCGSNGLISDVKAMVTAKFQPTKAKRTLALNITRRFSDIDARYTVPEVRGAIESINGIPSTASDEDASKGLALGMLYIDKYVEPMLKNVFPDDFVQHIER